MELYASEIFTGHISFNEIGMMSYFFLRLSLSRDWNVCHFWSRPALLRQGAPAIAGRLSALRSVVDPTGNKCLLPGQGRSETALFKTYHYASGAASGKHEGMEKRLTRQLKFGVEQLKFS